MKHELRMLFMHICDLKQIVKTNFHCLSLRSFRLGAYLSCARSVVISTHGFVYPTCNSERKLRVDRHPRMELCERLTAARNAHQHSSIHRWLIFQVGSSPELSREQIAHAKALNNIFLNPIFEWHALNR